MAPQTTNKGYEVQATGSNTGTWGGVLNDSVIEYLDDNIGGIATVTLASSNVTLTAEQSRQVILRLIGTLGANVVVTTEAIGFFFVENATTGAFTVTVRNADVATAATITQGTRQTVISDPTNGCRTMSSGFEAGVKTTFYMSTAPIGWTRDSTAALNNAAIRLVTTGGAATGGTADFTTVFASRTIAQANLPNITLTTSEDGNHDHGGDYTAPYGGDNSSGTAPICYINANGGSNSFISSGWSSTIAHSDSGHSISTTNTFDRAGPVYIPTGGAHDHTVPLGGSGTALDFAVKYADFMIATKD